MQNNIIPLPKNIKVIEGRDINNFKRLAQAVYLFHDDIARIADWVGTGHEQARELLNNLSFKEYLLICKQNPIELSPTRHELISRLSYEAERAERSTDRQRAIELLLTISGMDIKKKAIEKYRKMEGA